MKLDFASLVASLGETTALQIGLAIAGVAVLIAVIAYNRWSLRRHAPRQASLEASVPSAGDATEPRLDPVEPALDEGALSPLPLPEKRPGLDALVDAIAPIAIEGVVSGDAAIAALPPTRRAGSKPFAIEGQNEQGGAWEAPVAGQRYTAFQAGVQLASRTGAINEIEFSEFVMKAQGFADAVGGLPDFPEMLETVARARELDQFAGQHDAQLGFSIRARNAAWSPGYVQQHAARLGFVAGVLPGRMVLPGPVEGAPPILGLTFDSQAALSDDPAQSALYMVTLSLDVPQVLRSEKPFERLCQATIELARAMEGAIVDDRGQPVGAQVMETIHADLDRLYDALEHRGLSAGSPEARRLFS